MFHPQPITRLNDQFRVLYYSSYLPLHGVEHIVTAAGMLQDRADLHFRLIGGGMRYAQVRQLAQQLNVSNVEFLPQVPYAQLPAEIANADLCLGGPFGDTPKARRIIPGKTFQFLSMARPIIASDTPGNRELLNHERSAYLVPLADPRGLAAAIAAIQDDAALRETLAAGGHACYMKRCSEAIIRESLDQILLDSMGLS